jgi:hypothetical protein
MRTERDAIRDLSRVSITIGVAYLAALVAIWCAISSWWAR